MLLSSLKKIWWGDPDPDVLGVSAASSAGASLVLLNRAQEERWVSNGLEWADLPTEGTYRDHLSNDTFTPENGELNIALAPLQSRILIWEP